MLALRFLPAVRLSADRLYRLCTPWRYGALWRLASRLARELHPAAASALGCAIVPGRAAEAIHWMVVFWGDALRPIGEWRRGGS